MKGSVLTIISFLQAPFWEKIIGLAVAFLSTILFDVTTLIMTLWALMYVDFYFAVKVSNKRKGLNTNLFSSDFIKGVTRKKIGASIDKGLGYLLMIIAIYIVDRFIIDVDGFNILESKGSIIEIGAGVLAFAEFWSISSKFSELYTFNPIKILINLLTGKGVDETLKKFKENQN